MWVSLNGDVNWVCCCVDLRIGCCVAFYWFFVLVFRQSGGFVLGKLNSLHVKCYEKYFRVESLAEGGVRVVVDEAVLVLARRYFGYFALLSSEPMGLVSALELYRNKDLAEKAFGNVEERLNMRRTLVSCEQCLDGKLFVCYIGLIFLSYLKKRMQAAELFVHYTMQGLLDCLDVVACFEYPINLCVQER